MRRADRMIELVGLMKSASLCRADDLAAQLEVSVRTVYRDIASLQAQGFPIEGAAGVGYILSGPVELPPLSFGYDEIDALTLGLAYVEQVGDPELIAAARAARGKIDLVRVESRQIALSRQMLGAHQMLEHKAPQFFAMVRRALRERRIIAFKYRNLKDEQSHRAVRPLAVTAYSVGWLLVAWCEYRDDFRVFRLDRMANVSMTGSVFTDEPGRTIADYRRRRLES
ncbi:MAG: helix-turn-helix transcriptional regulator [Sphingorhabdus sp.]